MVTRTKLLVLVYLSPVIDLSLKSILVPGNDIELYIIYPLVNNIAVFLYEYDALALSKDNYPQFSPVPQANSPLDSSYSVPAVTTVQARLSGKISRPRRYYLPVFEQYLMADCTTLDSVISGA